MERAMRTALERGGVEPGAVKAVWAARCGLKVFDDAEAAAIERVLGSDAERDRAEARARRGDGRQHLARTSHSL